MHIIRALLAAFLLAVYSLGAAQSLGELRWNTSAPEPITRPLHDAIGVYVRASNTLVITLFSTPLLESQRRYWLASTAASLRGRFENQDFQRNADRDAELKALGEHSATLWVMLNDMSKHALPNRPPLHTKADLTGLLLCVGFNCRHYSGGVYGDEYEQQVTQLELPTPSAFVPNATAKISAAVLKTSSSGLQNSLQIRADIPITVVTD